MGIKAFFSNRIYKHTLPSEFVDAIHDALFRFNCAKQFACNTLVKEKLSGQTKREQSLHLLVKKKFQLDDYYANSAVQAANAQLKSLDELKKLYIENKTEQIRSIKRKLKKDRSRLTTLRKIKLSFIKDNPTFPKKAREQKQGHYFVVTFKEKTDIYYHAYSFEHTYLDPSIKRLKTRTGFLTSKLNRKKEELKQLRSHIPSTVFGTKKLFRSQYTKECYRDNHEAWVEEWKQSRYQKVVLSGRKDAAMGNFVFNYNIESNHLHFKTPSGVLITMEQVLFPYGQEKVQDAIQTQMNCRDKKKNGKPIAWAIEDHGDYYIFKCITDIEVNPQTSYAKSDGVMGIDCNVDHFAIANINAKGQLLTSHALRFDTYNKTSNQITKIIEAEAIEIVCIALKANKPIALEKLNTTTSKVSNPYGKKSKSKHVYVCVQENDIRYETTWNIGS